MVDTAGVDDFLGEAWLSQGGLVAGACNVNTKETFGSTFTAQLEIVLLEVGNEGINE